LAPRSEFAARLPRRFSAPSPRRLSSAWSSVRLCPPPPASSEQTPAASCRRPSRCLRFRLTPAIHPVPPSSLIPASAYLHQRPARLAPLSPAFPLAGFAFVALARRADPDCRPPLRLPSNTTSAAATRLPQPSFHARHSIIPFQQSSHPRRLVSHPRPIHSAGDDASGRRRNKRILQPPNQTPCSLSVPLLQ
jgi:hypothetical protein